ncbi:MAG: ATP-binding protein [Jaaginema sp. PMC 1079.18]|nr:ATP-binding protein [Jaaginema sp. PMC 1080.18]MEC4851376.1 ATP-binding protein [Jaaginema sp. PMC 1079.18]MEC4868816.1 ATP-binding protein [Jaaginema sp. PMC 1078.18]
MIELQNYPASQPPLPILHLENLTLESTLKDLFLYDFQVEVSALGIEVARHFEENTTLPGVILIENGEFRGMISRQRFWEHMSRPYSIELFYKRPLNTLYNFTKAEVLIFSPDTSIMVASQRSLQRSPKALYDPIIIEIEPHQYRTIDTHQLLTAQSKIHELTAKLLDEKTHAHRVQTEKMASLGKTVAGVAHEIRNPVTALRGNVNFLQEYYDNLVELLTAYQEELPQKSAVIRDLETDIELDFILEDAPRLLESMKVSSERMTQIVTSLRNFSRVDDKKLQEINVHDCIDSTLLILNNQIKQGITVKKDYQDLPPLRCYAGLLSQAIMNFLANALDALQERQEKADNTYQPCLEVTTRQLADYGQAGGIAIIIADNGAGIPPELQTKIFEEFFTTKPRGKGTGLGLAISYEIVTQKHHGEIKLRSRLDQGTTFSILLPLIAR